MDDIFDAYLFLSIVILILFHKKKKNDKFCWYIDYIDGIDDVFHLIFDSVLCLWIQVQFLVFDLHSIFHTCVLWIVFSVSKIYKFFLSSTTAYSSNL